jgi:hypothetical protein
MRLFIEQSNALAQLSAFRSWLDCTTNMSGYDFREGHLRLFPVTRENTGKLAILGFENSQGASAFGGKFNRLATEFPSHLSKENLPAIREP